MIFRNAILILLIASWLIAESVKGQGVDCGPDAVKLDGTWRFKYYPTPYIYDDSLFYQPNFVDNEWAEIQVPGHWDLQGFCEPGKNTIPHSVGLYRTTFELPSPMINKQVFIRFEGVQYGFEVYVNGKLAGTWASSYNAVDFNITKWVKKGTNLLAVKVSVNVKGFEFDFNDCWRLSGIYRSVILFSTSKLSIQDFTVKSYINSIEQSAGLVVIPDVINPPGKNDKRIHITGVLRSPDGKIVDSSSIKELSDSLSFHIRHPQLWTAESPYLYQLDITLNYGNKVLHQIQQQTGIREITIQDTILRLNGRPLKLRGVNHHDLVPGTGRTLTRDQILHDLLLIRKANINCIRTSHYPPDRRLLNLCDSLGFYVICEVPFGGGDSHLNDSSYGSILLTRTKATLLRDKNHPCIIIWSLGNENKLTPITEAVGRYVQKNDPSRRICYPQMGSYFNASYKTFPEFLEIYSPHYESAEWIRNFQTESLYPVILTEYAHSLGLSFGNMEDIWKEMFRNNKFCGGAVWHFQDQGILRKSEMPVNKNLPTDFAWLDSVSYFDTRGIDGTDGIVYSNRIPQVDYWLVQKVYSPIQFIEQQLTVKPGVNRLRCTVYNQYDFTNLSILKGEWKLYENQKIIERGNLSINCSPHDTITQELVFNFGEHPETDFRYLELDFYNTFQEKIYTHRIELLAQENYQTIKETVLHDLKEVSFDSANKFYGNTFNKGFFKYEFSEKDLSMKLSAVDGTLPLVEAMYLRTGRVLKISDKTNSGRDNLQYWDPFLLTSQNTKIVKSGLEKESYTFSGKADFMRGDKYPGEKISGSIQYFVDKKGIITVSYCFTPENTTGLFLEAGLSFLLSPVVTDFMWAGKGPYASYPDKYNHNGFGIYKMKKGDLNFNGNRSGIELALLTDSLGNGLAIIANDANLAVEIANNHIVVSHNAFVMGVGNKKNWAVKKMYANNVDRIEGKFSIVPLQMYKWPKKLLEVFGPPDKSLRPYQPFYHNYDLSW